jgi:endonuclease G
LRDILLALTAILVAVTHCSGPSTGGLGAPGQAGDCAASYLDAKQPELIDPKLKPQTTLICYRGYAVLFSGRSRTPLWSSELLTTERVRAARQLERVGEFHPDPHLAMADRSELDDYRRSGFDRGHMAPSGDMPTQAAQQESFSLANIVPQTAVLNRNAWSDLERYVRALAGQHGKAYIVTGPVFEGIEVQSLHGRVIVPTETFKAIYVPGIGSGAWLATNSDAPSMRTLSVAQLTTLIGIDPFPGLAASVKAAPMPFRAFTPRQVRHRKRIED